MWSKIIKSDIWDFWKYLWAWVLEGIEWARNGLSRELVVSNRVEPIGYFKKGDTVISRDGNIGRVWRVYRKIKDNSIVGCSVLWETAYKGEKISPFLPAEDLGDKFNPHIKLFDFNHGSAGGGKEDGPLYFPKNYQEKRG